MKKNHNSASRFYFIELRADLECIILHTQRYDCNQVLKGVIHPEDGGIEGDKEEEIREMYTLQLQSYARDSIDELGHIRQVCSVIPHFYPQR